ncbi:BTAD domain-containing putative transcriptional regulator [Spongiactinospora sp. TRM90649]|uniref:AfsR/SARP family transcriptional regulator n=1 Tax=Spongiactinospora sp. TRM90649 TaxID=3031114 RepID=UPI0023F7D7B2|nr:BTAD domain-containing putative transcriptional regulator [Spongiactinospora sp. TRM90649]MDF5752863.1 BTAD domain-containing putative transcriptional regulator [Spongiactinospora sp. TRM90649]
MDFAILGPVEVWADGNRLSLGGQKQRAMLVTLIRYANRPVSDDLLAEALWGDSPPRTAGDNLRLYASRLRRTLGADRIVRRHGGYQLTVRPEELDLHRFTTLADDGAAALRRGDHEEAAALLARAARVWRGTAYAELDPGEETLRLEESRLTTVENRVEAEIALGRGPELVAELVGEVAAHPLRERLRGQLMLTLARTGRRAEALTLYADTRRMLSAELGVEPGEELRDLHLSILRGDDLSGREPSPAQLPLNIPDFTGREKEVGELLGRLADDRSVPVVVISGMGGVGKSALAVHVAHRMLDAYPDGQLYANLGSTDPGSVLSVFLAALGIDGRSVPEDLQARAALFRSHLSRRRVLILLDNVTSESQVRWLLPGSPTCAMLATSRARLSGLEGAHLVDLDVLPRPAAMELFARVVGRERAETERQAAAEIIDLCGKMPLAVRIAGARLVARPGRTVAWLARRLRDEHGRLDQLVAGDQAVRASLSLSYVGLSEPARRAFRLLGLLDCPDFAAWVAAALLDRTLEEGEDLIDELVDAQLLGVFGADSAGNLRYRFHDLVRLYAREHTSPEDGVALSRALGGWLALAERAMLKVPAAPYAVIHGPSPRWEPPESVLRECLSDPVAWFADERRALIAAVRQACAHSLDDLAWDLAACMERYFDVKGFFDDCRGVNELALELCRRTGNRLGEAVMLRGLLDVMTWIGAGYDGAAMYALNTNAQLLVEMFGEIGEKRGLSDAHAMRAWGLAAMGEGDEALEHGRLALRLARETDHLGGQARAHVAMAVAYGEARVEQAVPHLRHALEVAGELGNRRLEATALQFLGISHTVAGRYEEAQECLAGSLEICRTFSDPSAETLTLTVLARCYAAQGDAQARRTAETAESMSRQYNLSHHLADALCVLGTLDLAEGRVAAAVGHLEESVALWRARGWASYLARTLLLLADAYTARGDLGAGDGCRAEAAQILS